LGASFGRKSEMRAGACTAVISDPEERLVRGAEPRVRTAPGLLRSDLGEQCDSEAAQCRQVESLRSLEVGNRETGVIDHVASHYYEAARSQ